MLEHIDAGGIQDTALPGTYAAEATRLTKNGLSVAAFAAFEQFVRDRAHELLTAISDCPDLPNFEHLPKDLQLAATKGVFEAARFRLGIRNDALEINEIVAGFQEHARIVAATTTRPYSFSVWTVGYGSSNVSAGDLIGLLKAVGAGNYTDKFDQVLTRWLNFDYESAGLASASGAFKLSNLFGWRHAAAHDSGNNIDVPVLRTRLTAYLAVAFAFDLLASVAVESLIGRFPSFPVDPIPGPPSLDTLAVWELTPKAADRFELRGDIISHPDYFSPAHCRETLGESPLPSSGAIVVRNAQGQAIDWFYR